MPGEEIVRLAGVYAYWTLVVLPLGAVDRGPTRRSAIAIPIRTEVRHGEWSRRDASDMDGLSREAEWSFLGKAT
jgi:hypothetical protein